MGITVVTYPKGLLGENTYLLRDNETGKCAVIDPGYIGDDVMSEIGDRENLDYVLLTHAHFDHFYCAADYIKQFPNMKFVAPEKDKLLMFKDWSQDPTFRMSPKCPEADIYISEGDTLALGNSELQIIETPGHTAGGVCIKCDDVIFTGDTLFRLSVGNTSFETGSWEELVKSVTRLYELDDDITVYPGHGDITSIGYEKRANPFV